MKFLLRDDLRARGHRFSNKHLLHLEAIGHFPRRVYLGQGRTPAWVADEIEAHEAARIAERDTDPLPATLASRGVCDV
jgi:predicted DNA-binding transcriptional regulator AlpA